MASVDKAYPRGATLQTMEAVHAAAYEAVEQCLVRDSQSDEPTLREVAAAAAVDEMRRQCSDRPAGAGAGSSRTAADGVQAQKSTRKLSAEEQARKSRLMRLVKSAVTPVVSERSTPQSFYMQLYAAWTKALCSVARVSTVTTEELQNFIKETREAQARARKRRTTNEAAVSRTPGARGRPRTARDSAPKRRNTGGASRTEEDSADDRAGDIVAVDDSDVADSASDSDAESDS